MITFLTVILTIAMVLDCLVLMLLVLIQLPKKEAGAGLAFGGGATDALFGAGSGNVLTSVTKWAAGIFFGLALILSMLNSHARSERPDRFSKALQAAPIPTAPGAGTAPTVTPTNTPAATNAVSAPVALTTPASNAVKTATTTAGSNAPAGGEKK